MYNSTRTMVIATRLLVYQVMISYLSNPLLFLLTMSDNNIIFTILSVHMMIFMENHPVDPDNIEGSHRPVSFMRIKYIPRANDLT